MNYTCNAMLSLLFLSGSVHAAFDATVAFEKKCSSCHTIGGGVLKGPDLKGVGKRRSSDWIVKFVQSSSSLIASGDVEAVKLFNQFEQKEMPDQNLSKEDVLELIAFIETGGTQTQAVAARSALDATDQDKARGRELFLGSIRLSGGGPPCVSCHSVGIHGPLGGGTLAKDLTHTYSAYKDQGLSVALKKLAFPVMGDVFAGRGLTDQESFEIKSFLYEEDLNAPPTPDYQKNFAFLGLGGLVMAMGVIDLSWRRRRTKSVRRSRGGLR